ncbi:15535_t:CDS:1, partial [Cetraspora pellucida]
QNANMNLNSRAQYKLVSVSCSDINFKEYKRILEALYPLDEQYNHEISKMRCSYICTLFRKILE